MNHWTAEKVRKDFPILDTRVRNQNALVYLDHAATAQKPRSVIERMTRYYEHENANVHRGIYELSEIATREYENARATLSRFLGGVSEKEIILTSGTTAAMNLVASSWGRSNISEGDVIAVTRMEHHANFVPWQSLALEKKARFVIVELDADGRIDFASLKSVLTQKPKVLALTWMSNVLGTINPVGEIAQMAKAAGVEAIVLDAAQGICHQPLRWTDLGPVDFLAFSSHKLCGPTGVGVLWGRQHLLEKMPPYQFGGDMISSVKDDHTLWNELPWKFEAGTPNIAGVIGFDQALKYLMDLGMVQIARAEEELGAYALDKIRSQGIAQIFGPQTMKSRGSVFSFAIPGVHPHDVATFMDSRGIAVRAGHHCAQPLMKWLGVTATSRASLSFYTTRAEVDFWVDTVAETQKFFGRKG